MTRLLVFLLLLSLPAYGQTRVVDGDTLEIDGTRWRVFGIDAPEKDQTCPDGWHAGRVATDGLRSLLEGKTLTCEPRGHDRYGRTIGLCRASGTDIGAEMVRRGLAWSFTRYSTDYAHLEDQARALRVGIWQHNCQPAWEWRRAHR